MRTVIEPFHGTVPLHRVVEPDALLAHLSELMGTKDTRRFPGPNPCSLERADYPKLKSQMYWLCEKTDGVRALMMCTRLGSNDGSIDVCCLIDRTMAVYLLPLQALTTAMFQGSVVDCEVAFNRLDNVWELLCFDAYVLSGSPVSTRPLSRRIACLTRAMQPYQARAQDCLRVRAKDFIAITAWDVYMKMANAKAMAYAIDGLILTPEMTPPCPGRCPDLLKLKTRHTIDFLIGNDGLELGVYDAAKRTHVGIGRLHSIPPGISPGDIVECESPKSSNGAWHVLCARRDKTTANDMLTYTKTLVNIKEGITLAELQEHFSSV